ncbi:hypothetical protein FACS1894104_3240 [Actinomycetota bacterium]|nr:hypothetical protein FACS1894104_3240 [Actinomycetota bacterium]
MGQRGQGGRLTSAPTGRMGQRGRGRLSHWGSWDKRPVPSVPGALVKRPPCPLCPTHCPIN